MKRPRLIAFCVFLLSVAGSGFVFSQIPLPDSEEFNQAYYNDLQTSRAEMNQLELSLNLIYADMGKNIREKIQTQLGDSPMTPDEMVKARVEITVDEMIGVQKPISEKTSEFFSENGYQKMLLRLFQLKMGFMERLKATDSQEVFEMASRLDTIGMYQSLPGFLELSREQRELITKQQRETSIDMLTLARLAFKRMRTDDPEILAEIQRLADELQKAETGDEKSKIAKKLNAFDVDVDKAIAPEMKKLLLKGHEDFMRVLTDAQKAKIKAMMAEMPDYMKKLFAEVDQGGDASNVLNLWVPGMGVPDYPNPNREATPERTNTSGRTFPGN